MKPRAGWPDWPVRATRLFAPDHPALAGHFPGHPVLPGALLLDWACAQLAGAQPLALSEVRFARPCGPGSRLALRAKTDGNATRFAITALDEGGAEALAVSGALEPMAACPAPALEPA